MAKILLAAKDSEENDATSAEDPSSDVNRTRKGNIIRRRSVKQKEDEIAASGEVSEETNPEETEENQEVTKPEKQAETPTPTSDSAQIVGRIELPDDVKSASDSDAFDIGITLKDDTEGPLDTQKYHTNNQQITDKNEEFDRITPIKPIVGMVIKGVVSIIKPYGIFVDLPGCAPQSKGLLHISQMVETKHTDPTKSFKEGEFIEVEIIKIDEHDKISLSSKSIAERRERTEFEQYSTSSNSSAGMGKMSDIFKNVKLDKK